MMVLNIYTAPCQPQPNHARTSTAIGVTVQQQGRQKFGTGPHLPDHKRGVGVEGVEESAQRVGGRSAVAMALQEQERQNTVRDALY